MKLVGLINYENYWYNGISYKYNIILFNIYIKCR